MNKEKKKVQVLEVKLEKSLVGHLAGYSDGKNIFREPIITNFKLHSIFSNLLPEKELKKLAAQRLKIDDDNELEMLIGLGRGLPRSIVVRKLTKKEIPPYALEGPVEIEKVEPALEANDEEFSLAGIMMKFSMYEEAGIHHMGKRGHLGNWIVKTPSITHKHVPLNEFTTMKLAEAVGVLIPEIIKTASIPRILPKSSSAIQKTNTENTIMQLSQILSKTNGQSYSMNCQCMILKKKNCVNIGKV